MKIGELQERLQNCYSVAHLRRWAHEGKIPGAKQFASGHFKFRKSPKLNEWIKETIHARALAKNGAVMRKQARTPRAVFRRESNDYGVKTILEVARQFERDYVAGSRQMPGGYSPAYATELLNILEPVFRDLTLRMQTRVR
jgi:hypothetical protein